MIVVDILSGFLIALLAGLGVGGGGLLVIYLALVRHTDQLLAQGINLVFFIVCALAALLYNVRQRALEPGKLFLIAVSGAAFAGLGSRMAAAADTSLIRKCFGGLMCLSGIVALIRTFKGEGKNPDGSKKERAGESGINREKRK